KARQTGHLSFGSCSHFFTLPVATGVSEGVSKPEESMQRRLELDAARGLMLVWMTLTHLPTIASTIANQPFGFVSPAEGFIFLCALFTGRIYSTLAEREGSGSIYRRLWGRTIRLYAYHLALLLFAFLVESRIASRGHRPGLYNLLDFYFAVGPKRAIVDA